MISKINNLSFRGTLLVKATMDDMNNPLRLEWFNTDNIRDIQKMPSSDTVIVYQPPLKCKQMTYLFLTK